MSVSSASRGTFEAPPNESTTLPPLAVKTFMSSLP
ncbi:hypothetical protein MFUL124B02_14505 [Myxococcus fulvus 124B02]|nr:hypothetical protein MFUL124B02_14505 [Myxococcus fulvus 124B02]